MEGELQHMIVVVVVVVVVCVRTKQSEWKVNVSNKLTLLATSNSALAHWCTLVLTVAACGLL
jgi:hypothetical protein